MVAVFQPGGMGQPAIVIGSARYYQRAFSQDLRRHLRLAFIDHRGFAPSPGPVDVSEFTLEKLIDDVEAFRQQLGLGPLSGSCRSPNIDVIVAS